MALGTEEALSRRQSVKIGQNDEKDVILDLSDGLFGIKEFS